MNHEMDIKWMNDWSYVEKKCKMSKLTKQSKNRIQSLVTTLLPKPLHERNVTSKNDFL